MIMLIFACSAYVGGQDKPAGNSGAAQVAKAVGTIKSIQSDSITVASESGGDVTAKLSSSTKILRVPPGEKDLKNATTLQPQDLQTGDRVLVRGQASADGHTIAALAVIVMKQADVVAKQQQDRDDWQKRGVGGLVTNVDATAGTITISSGGGAVTARNIAVHVTNNTILRRYAPDSVNFDDAKPAPINQIKPGDQLRARGTRSPDGSELTAEEVVTGSFRNIAGTIKAIDTASNTMTVQDAISKNAVVVKVTSDSQIKKLPPEIAQRLAMRLKSTAGGGNGGQADANGKGQNIGSGQGISPSAGGMRPTTGSQASQPAGGPGGGGPPDIQRMLNRLPNTTLADLQKGDAVMIVSTEGGNSDAVTAITLLAGVEPILTAAPNRSASSLLSPWSLSASGGEGEGAQ
jgi:co-chaperonin GroES (HSP10)